MKKIVTTILILLTGIISYAQWDRDVFSWRGQIALEDGRYAQAIENFNILARLDSTDYWTFFFRGIAKYNLGDIRGAQKDFNTSVRLNPVFTNGYHYRAITESRFGDYESALDDFRTAISLRPGFTGLYFSRGVTYFLARDFDRAIEDFDKYIRQEDSNPTAYLNRGMCHLFSGDTLRALTDYNKAIRLDRFRPEGYIRRGQIYAGMHLYEEAIEDMNKAVDLDSTNTFALFNRALLCADNGNPVQAISDLDAVLKYEPGNALTLYNRSILRAGLLDYDGAIEDMDRVISINPGNVLAYFNRAAFLTGQGRLKEALEDYDRAIDLYPDFAKAYINRSHVEYSLGMKKKSKQDYDTGMQKVREYYENGAGGPGSLADTTVKVSRLLAFDAEFAKKDFDDELLQHRDIDIRLKPMFRIVPDELPDNTNYAHSNRYENPLLSRFISESVSPVRVSGTTSASAPAPSYAGYDQSRADILFLKGLSEIQKRQYNAALRYFDAAIDAAGQDGADDYSRFYRAFYLMNRGVLKADMIEFIASMESNVQTLTMDDQGAARTRIGSNSVRNYDYSDAIDDMQAAVDLVPDIPYLYYNLGNMYTLSSQPVAAISQYDRAIELWPQMGEAIYNRALVLILIKDREKGCIDLSRAGELGVSEAYAVIKKYCEDDR